MFYRLIFGILLIVNFSYSATFDELLKDALKHSPYLKSFEYEKKSFKGDVLKAEKINNPEIEVEFGRLYSQTESGFALTSFSISQQLRLWGEKEFALKSAKLKKKAYDHFYQQKKNILAGKIYQLFYEILLLDEEIKIKEKELKNLEKLHSFIKKKYELGDALIIDVLRVEKDISLVKVELENLKAQKKAKESYLFSIVGTKPQKLEGNLYNFKNIQKIDLENLPLFKYYSLLIKSYDEEIKRQKALSKPQISIGFVADEDPVETGKYEFGVSISSTLPIFYKNQGEIIKLLNEKKKLLSEMESYKLQYKAQINSIGNQYKILTSQIKKIDTGAIQRLKKTLEIAQLGYKEGTLTFLELSNVRKQYFETLIYKSKLAYEVHKLYGELIKIGGIK